MALPRELPRAPDSRCCAQVPGPWPDIHQRLSEVVCFAPRKHACLILLFSSRDPKHLVFSSILVSVAAATVPEPAPENPPAGRSPMKCALSCVDEEIEGAQHEAPHAQSAAPRLPRDGTSCPQSQDGQWPKAAPGSGFAAQWQA